MSTHLLLLLSSSPFSTALSLSLETFLTLAQCFLCSFTKSVGSNALLAASAPFTVQDTCKLEPEEACYVLNIEAGMPIFAVGIQSSISLQLLDVASNVAIMSRSPPDEENGNLTLATYRCQVSMTRPCVSPHPLLTWPTPSPSPFNPAHNDMTLTFVLSPLL